MIDMSTVLRFLLTAIYFMLSKWPEANLQNTRKDFS